MSEFEKRYETNMEEGKWEPPNPKTIMKWIEEAKKEFPRIKYAQHHSYLMPQIYRWFVKWFGKNGEPIV